MKTKSLLQAWTRKAPKLVWTLAVIGTASAGIMMGAQESAHSDLGKYSAMLAAHEHVPGEVVVKLNKAGQFALRFQTADQVFNAAKYGISSVDAFETDGSFFKVSLNQASRMAEFLAAANKNPAIAYAEPNYILKISGARSEEPTEVVPNDAMFEKLWGMKNVGQKDGAGTPGLAGADIGATKAWSTTTGNKNIIVAVIDTGVDYTHPDLVGNIYMNPGESGDGKERNGIDDDGNGFVDDFRGWNFAGVSTNDPMDDNDHGTHCAGTIGAKGNDGAGVVGVAWTTSILPIKFLTGGGSGTLADAVKSIQYATKMGAHVMSNSWGGGGFTQSMFDAIKEAKEKGLLFIAAAGNDSQNADNIPHYPAGYQVDNVIAVAASTNRDTLASFSTFGKRTVHIAAPGHKIVSTIAGGKYDDYSGTSMATPHVSGAAALLWGTDESMTYADVKDRLLRSRDFVPGLARKVASSGRLNIYNAINGIYPPSPEPAESDWRDFSINAIESEHPYKDNAKQEWTIEGPADAKYMRVVFEKVDLESGYDFVKLYDAQSNEVDAVSGKAENQSSFYVPGNKIVVKFSADSSQTGWGFKIGKAQIVR